MAVDESRASNAVVDLQTGSREARERISDEFFEGTGASYDKLVRWSTLGLDGRWKAAMLRHVVAHKPNPRRILDLACGTGIVSMKLAKRFPDAELVGVDYTAEYMEIARARMKELGRAMTFVHSNAETAELEGTFDLIVSSYLPKYCDPDRLLTNLDPYVEEGAVVVLHDFTRPKGRPGRWLWRRWMKMLGNTGVKIWPEWKNALDTNLCQIIEENRWPTRYGQAFGLHGYDEVIKHRLHHSLATMVTARKMAPGRYAGIYADMTPEEREARRVELFPREGECQSTSSS